MEENNKKRGRPKKAPEETIQVQRPINHGPKQKFNGRFKSVEPLGSEQPARKGRYKWNHKALTHWIMGQADPAGFLASVMAGKEIFPVYSRDSLGKVENVGKVSADPELRVMAAKTLLSKCVPDLKSVEVNTTHEERKVIDISRLDDNDLTTIERVLEHAVLESDPSGEESEESEGVYQKLLGDDGTRS
jgi:type IV secretory pathway TrbF-like protein